MEVQTKISIKKFVAIYCDKCLNYEPSGSASGSCLHISGLGCGFYYGWGNTE